MKRLALIGASGYVGRELAHICERHPSARLEACYSARAEHVGAGEAGETDGEFEPIDWKRLERADGVFLCTPHGVSAPLAERLLASGATVVDLSADFRLRDADLYARTYAQPHGAPALLHRAVYGLTEHARDALRSAELVANPGCYPTAVLLALRPLLSAGLVRTGSTIVADCKSGLSGAGKAATARTHFGSVHDNFQAYGAGTHRHAPEIEQEARALADVRVAFVPHLLPVFRGILASVYLEPARGARASEFLEALASAYEGEPFVRVPATGLPDLHAVQHTNRCHLGAADVADRVLVVSAIDNLIKGAAGQALQNMNLALGLEETAGLA